MGPADTSSSLEYPARRTPICPHCARPITPDCHFCPHCDGPISAHASTDPYGQIFSTGRALGRATTRPNSFYVVFGVWLLLLPQVLLLLFALGPAIMAVVAPGQSHWWFGPMVTPESTDRIADAMKVAFLLGILFLYGTIIVMTTRSYVRRRIERNT